MAYRSKGMIVEDYSDYREVNGVKIAFVTNRVMWTGTGDYNSTTTITRLAINENISDAMFAVPEEDKTPSLPR